MRRMRDKDYYGILGVAKDSDEKTIKKAYRKLAKKYHPDTSRNDPAAEAKFKEISEAYSVLGDQEKRKLYDTYGTAAFQEGFDPNQFARGFGNDTGSFRFDGRQAEDLFRDLFGAGGGFRTGGDGSFHGFGSFGGESGSGGTYYRWSGFGGDPSGGESGPFGRGRERGSRGQDLESDVTISFDEAVRGCDRTFTITGENGTASTISAHIPAGIDEGKKVRLKGKGYPGYGGAPDGDLYLKVHILPKKGYERKGKDVYVKVDVPYTVAALGGEVMVPALRGSVMCRIPAGTQSGAKIRLKGQGIVSMRSPETYGDAYVVVRITVPRSLTSREKELLEELASIRGHQTGNSKNGNHHAA